jgi:hypothetical protein
VKVKRAMSWLRNVGQDYQNQECTASRKILRGHNSMIYAGRDRILRNLGIFERKERRSQQGKWGSDRWGSSSAAGFEITELADCTEY